MLFLELGLSVSSLPSVLWLMANGVQFPIWCQLAHADDSISLMFVLTDWLSLFFCGNEKTKWGSIKMHAYFLVWLTSKHKKEF